jgi:hypothetical protein
VKGIERGVAVLPISRASKPPNLNSNITSVYRIDYKLAFYLAMSLDLSIIMVYVCVFGIKKKTTTDYQQINGLEVE